PDTEGAHFEKAPQRGRRVLKAQRFAGEGDAAINIEPVLLEVRRNLPHEPALGVLDPRLLFKNRVDFQKAVVDWIVVVIEDHFDDAVTFVHRLKERAESGFAFPPRLLGLLALGYILK